MTFRQAEEYLLGLELFGMRFGLDRMRKLMTVLDLPQERFASVHVVGTNGKSSTVRFTAAILERHGRRTGSYTSPHLRSFRERIEVGEAPVSDADFAAAVERAPRTRPRSWTGPPTLRTTSRSSRRSPRPRTASSRGARWTWRWWRPGSAGATTQPA